MKNYEILEHTADIGIRVKAGDAQGLFKEAALAMFDIMAERQGPEAKGMHVAIEVKADDLQELFVNWLNELLSLSAVKELIFTDFQIEQFDDKSLKAKATGKDLKSYKVNTEIKAATYHGLKIEEAGGDWEAEVIFDV
ncbi:archease [Candidatus Omnitrophota bacterium]